MKAALYCVSLVLAIAVGFLVGTSNAQVGCDVDYEMLAKYLQIFLSLPVLGFFFILVFYEEIRQKLRNMKKDPWGTEYELQDPLPTPKSPSAGGRGSDSQARLDDDSNAAIADPTTAAGWWHFSFLNLWLLPHTKRVLKYIHDFGPHSNQALMNYWVGAGMASDECKRVIAALEQALLIAPSPTGYMVTKKGRNFLNLIAPQFEANDERLGGQPAAVGNSPQ